MIYRRGHCLDDHDEHRAQLIPDFPAGPGAAAHEDAQGKAQEQGNGEGDQSQLEGDGHLLRHDLIDGDPLAVAVGGAQVPGEELLAEIPQLLGQWVLQSKLGEAHVDLGLGELVKVLKIPLDGHEPQQGKENGGDDGHGEK